MSNAFELWLDFKAHGSERAREQLILHYSPLVRYVAAQFAATCPPNYERADLASYGTFGLIDAIEKFEPSRGFKFQTYAIVRIKGAIIDELRSIDWVPRRVRSNARELERASSSLEGELGRSPSRAELAAELGVGPERLERVISQIASTWVSSLDEPLGASFDEDGAATLGARIPAPGNPFDDVETTDTLTGAIEVLSDRERLVITLYYYELLSLAEIGAVLGVTESRVCQIHTKSIGKLRRHLQNVEQPA
jgi:RNA polymerase sigma factor FliA